MFKCYPKNVFSGVRQYARLGELINYPRALIFTEYSKKIDPGDARSYIEGGLHTSNFAAV